MAKEREERATVSQQAMNDRNDSKDRNIAKDGQGK